MPKFKIDTTLAPEVVARQYIEAKLIRAVMREVLKAGYKLDTVWDSERYIKVRTQNEALAAIFAVDSATLHFRNPAIEKSQDLYSGVFFVLGNGVDVISDWHCGDKVFDAAVTRATDLANALN